jgi:hypothetical protein
MPRANPQQNKKYYSCDPRQTHGDFHNKIGQQETLAGDRRWRVTQLSIVKKLG